MPSRKKHLSAVADACLKIGDDEGFVRAIELLYWFSDQANKAETGRATDQNLHQGRNFLATHTVAT